MPIIGTQPPLIRENRLYQTDWLLRFYGYDVKEILNDLHPNLEMDIDPKLSWALRNPGFFPVDINTDDYQMVLRVPGIGVRSAQKIVASRKFGKLHIHQLKKMGIAYNRARHFIRCADSPFQLNEKEPHAIKNIILQNSKSKYLKNKEGQLSLF